MTAHDTAHATDASHVEHDHVKIYLRVFTALAVFTAAEYFYAKIFKDGFVVLILGLMTLAIIKAGLVGLYFMHLKWEGKWVLAMLVPASILAMVVLVGLTPDVALKPTDDFTHNDDDDSATPVVKAPQNPGEHGKAAAH
jgi:cytochrome c oxidase subunit 4